MFNENIIRDMESIVEWIWERACGSLDGPDASNGQGDCHGCCLGPGQIV